jgi:hypothetical protein
LRFVAPDFSDHAKNSISFLEQKALDRNNGAFRPYFRITLHRKPGFFSHANWDWSENLGRWLYGSLYARRILGSTSQLDFAQSLRREIYAGLGEDGLHYYPSSLPCGMTKPTNTAMLWDNRSIFVGLTQLWLITGDEEIKGRLDKMVEALDRYSVKVPKNKEIYFAVRGITPGYRPKPVANPVVGQNSGGWISPLVGYYQHSKSEKALQLALGLANFVVNEHRHRPPNTGPVLGIANVHGALYTIAGVVETVEYSGNKKHVAWAHALYEYARDHLASDYGWVAEHERIIPVMYPPGTKMSTEGCAIVDLAHLAIRLAQHGYPDAWNVVERFARNYMDAGQLRETQRLEGRSRSFDTPCRTNEGMPDRAKGAFVGWGAPNDFLNPLGRHGAMVQDCCGSHYPYGLHLVWENIATKEADGIHINLALNRRTPWCEVVSKRPRSGQVSIRMYKSGDLFVRVPDWVDKSQVSLRIGNENVDPTWVGDYVQCRHLNRGMTAQVAYPLRQMKRPEQFMGYQTKVIWVGDTVVGVSPSGRIVPLFDGNTTRT